MYPKPKLVRFFRSGSSRQGVFMASSSFCTQQESLKTSKTMTHDSDVLNLKEVGKPAGIFDACCRSTRLCICLAGFCSALFDSVCVIILVIYMRHVSMERHNRDPAASACQHQNPERIGKVLGRWRSGEEAPDGRDARNLKTVWAC